MSRLRVAVVAALTVAVAVPVASSSATEPAAPASPTAIRAYHDSGEWAKDFKTQWSLANKDLKKALAKKKKGTPTLVLDIDDTVLSTYACANKLDFIATASATCIVTSDVTPIAGAIALVKTAVKQKVKIAFITARPESPTFVDLTKTQLKTAGITAKYTLNLRPTGYDTAAAYKTATRKAMTAKGARIVLSVGDQKSDLSGGFAQYTVKLPNPMYVNK